MGVVADPFIACRIPLLGRRGKNKTKQTRGLLFPGEHECGFGFGCMARLGGVCSHAYAGSIFGVVNARGYRSHGKREH